MSRKSAFQSYTHSRANLIKWISQKDNVVYLFGHGTKNPYADFSQTFKDVQKWFKDTELTPFNTHLVYFGDAANVEKPDIGWLACQLVEKQKYELGMIQLQRAKSWGEPPFVSKKAIRWHGKKQETEEEKKIWGGVNEDGEPVMNTQELHAVCQALPTSVTPYFLFVGGGPTAAAEYQFLQEQDYAKASIFYIPALGVTGLGDIDAIASSSSSSCVIL